MQRGDAFEPSNPTPTSGKMHGSRPSVHTSKGYKIEKAILVHAPAEQCYAYWRDLTHLPRIMLYLESLTILDERRSHWVVKGPRGKNVEWDAEIINDHPNEMLAWRSLEGSSVSNAGSVHFHRVPGGNSTEVRVMMEYEPPAGKLGAALAKLFKEDPERQVEDTLERFKVIMEKREISGSLGRRAP